MKLKKAITLILIVVLLLSFTLNTKAASFFTPIDANGVIVADMNTGEILYKQNADEPMPPASTAKIMTALLVLEAVERGEIDLNEEIVVRNWMLADMPADASRMDQEICGGEVLKIKDLLAAHLIVSDCYASAVLAALVSGSMYEFCTLMNERADELGCNDTHFVDPSGYPHKGTYATARSMLLITLEAMKFDVFRELVKTTDYIIPASNCYATRYLSNTNRLLFEIENPEPVTKNTPYHEYDLYYPGTIGIKTGTSSSSGACLVAAAERDSYTVIAVILGAKVVQNEDKTYTFGQFMGAAQMFDSAFALLEDRADKAALQSVKRIFGDRNRLISVAHDEYSAQVSEILEFEETRQIELVTHRDSEANTHQRMSFIFAIVAAALFVIFFIYFLIKLIIYFIKKNKTK